MFIVEKSGIVHCVLQEPTKTMHRAIRDHKSEFALYVDTKKYAVIMACVACALLVVNISVYTLCSMNTTLICSLALTIVSLNVVVLLFGYSIRENQQIQEWLDTRDNAVEIVEEKYQQEISLALLVNNDPSTFDMARPALSYDKLVASIVETPELVDDPLVHYFTATKSCDVVFPDYDNYCHVLDDRLRDAVGEKYNAFARKAVTALVSQLPNLTDTVDDFDFFDGFDDEMESILLDYNVTQLLADEEE